MPKVLVSNDITITGASPYQVAALYEQLDFYYLAEQPDGTKSNELYPVVQQRGGTVVVPYGALQLVRSVLREATYEYATTWHQRRQWEAVFSTKDRASQQETLAAVYEAFGRRQYGLCFIAPCGAGKTRMGIRLIAEIGRPTLVVVHTKELLHQWTERLSTDIPQLEGHIGIIGDGAFDIKPVTVGLVQTLSKTCKEIDGRFSVVLMDEAHHVPAVSFATVVNAFRATVKIGITASERRRDRMHPLLYATIGPIISRISQRDLTNDGVVMAPLIKVVPTGWNYSFSSTTVSNMAYTRMMKHLVESRTRNNIIVDEIIDLVESGRNALVLSARIDHLEVLRAILVARHPGMSQMLTGRQSKKERIVAMERMVAGFPVTFATTQLAKEGLDAPLLSGLVFATPSRDFITVQQSVGRVQRSAAGKLQPVVIDFADNVGILSSQLASRMAIYNKLGGQYVQEYRIPIP